MSQPLRISLVTETYFPQVNGVSRTLDRLVRHCTEGGDRVQLLLPRYPQGTDRPAGRGRTRELAGGAAPLLPRGAAASGDTGDR